jgi:hypothetical protein
MINFLRKKIRYRVLKKNKVMTNKEKSDYYNSLLLKHDMLHRKVSDIKSEAAGTDLNGEQNKQLRYLENQKAKLIAEAHRLIGGH